jgi:hypothetical protein
VNAIAVVTVTINGDIGGQGVNRWAVQSSDGATYSPTFLNATAAAIAQFYSSSKTYLAASVTYAVQPVATIVEDSTGAIIGEDTIPVVSNVVGGSSTTYAGGTGARVYWHTPLVRNRRLVRGATYLTPVVGAGFTSTGYLASSYATTVQAAANAYIAAITAANGMPVVLCRPKKGMTTGGMSATISSATVSTKPCSLRSRRS